MPAFSECRAFVPPTSAVETLLHSLMLQGTSWAEVGTDPRTGVSCWGLVQYAYAQAGLNVPVSACEASEHFVRVEPPYQAWDMPVAHFATVIYGTLHVGLLLTADSGFHCSRATNGLARFRLSDMLWRRGLRHVYRLRVLACT